MSRRPIIPPAWDYWSYSGMAYRRRFGVIEVFAQNAWRPSVLFLEKPAPKKRRRAA